MIILLKKYLLFLFLLLKVTFLEAQSDSLVLACPLVNGTPRIIRASDKDYQKSSEYGVMFTSKTDTLVQAVHDAQVVLVARNPEDQTFDVVLQYKSYMFWYSGVISTKTKQGSRVKAGDIIGTYKTGNLLELLMYLREEPVNPRKYLLCK